MVKRTFRNRTQGVIGAVMVRRGVDKGIPVRPGEVIQLTDEEIELTAAAPRDRRDNPFEPRAYKLYDPATGEVTEEGVAPALEEILAESRTLPDPSQLQSSEHEGDGVVKEGETEVTGRRRRAPDLGSRAQGEEVGTPTA